jgi:hypothetical protein
MSCAVGDRICTLDSLGIRKGSIKKNIQFKIVVAAFAPQAISLR